MKRETHQMTRSVLTGLVSALAVVALGACGGSTKVETDTQSTSTTRPSHRGHVRHSRRTRRTRSTTAASSSSISPGGRPQLCRANDLSVSFLGQQGAAGHGVLGFALRNRSGHSCITLGFPGVLFRGVAGAPLPTASTRTTHDVVGSAPVKVLKLGPGDSASFRLVVTHGISSSAGCTKAHGVQVIAPDDTATLVVSIPGGAYECGRTTVSALQAGNKAYP